METIINDETQRRRNRRQNIISLIIIIVGTILSFLIFGPKDKSQEEAEITLVSVVETMILGEEESQTAKLEKTAVLKSNRSADAVAEYTGRIRQVNFEAGKYVGRGAVLAVFDQSGTENTAKINLDSAEKSFELAQRNLKKTKELLKSELGRGEESAKILVNTARIQREQAELQLEQARIAFGKTIIKAPISGTVVSKNIENGDYVTSGQIVAQISGGGKLEATVSLNATQIKRIETGDEMDIIISGESFKGEISSFSSIAGNNERFEVKIQSSEDLSDEANKSAKIVLTLRLDEEKTGSFFVPLEAVTIGQRKTEIFVVEYGKSRIREVETGKVIGTKVEIIKGLDVGDEVVAKNGRNLQDGQEISVEN